MEVNEHLIINSIKLGDICRYLRVLQNMSQESVANDIGLSVSTVERIENGKVIPRVDSLEKILLALDFELVLRPKNDHKNP